MEAARPIRTKQFVLDGEAWLLGFDGISDFDGLYSGQHNDEIQLYAFDILCRRATDEAAEPATGKREAVVLAAVTT